jgi:serine O-acetyltransferase
MNLSLSRADLQAYLSAQVNHFFPDKSRVEFSKYDTLFNNSIDRLEYCFDKVCNHRYNLNGQPYYNHLYADHNIVFIWFLANEIWKQNSRNSVSDKLYYLNKTLHAFDCMYDTNLPDVFLIFHGAGTMLGKAEYGNYFVALQGCTVGSHKDKYPVIGQGVSLTAHSSIIGNCHVGNRVSIASCTCVFEKSIEDDTVVFSDKNSGNTLFKRSNTPYAQQFFSITL